MLVELKSVVQPVPKASTMLVSVTYMSPSSQEAIPCSVNEID